MHLYLKNLRGKLYFIEISPYNSKQTLNIFWYVSVSIRIFQLVQI